MRKLVWLTLGFTLAILVGLYCLWSGVFLLSAAVAAAALAVSLVAVMKVPKLRLCAMMLAGMTLGFSWLSIMDQFYWSTPRQLENQTLMLTVTATDYSVQTQYGAVTHGRVEVSGKHYRIRFYHEREVHLSPGDRVTGSFHISTTLPLESFTSNYNRSKGIFLTASVKEALQVQKSEELPWYGYPVYWRQQLLSRIDAIFPMDTAAFAKALLLGDTQDLDYATDVAFQRSGIRHVIAVSGLHVSILFSLIFLLTFRRRWLTALVAMPILLLFAAVVGFSPSITRACVMQGLILLATLVDREYDSPTALAFAVLLMLLADPWTATDVSFQLSVGCMMGIILLAKPIENWILDPKRLGAFRGYKARLSGWFATTVGISVGASVFTIPLSALYFGTVSLVGVVTNLLTLWLITYIFYGILLSCALSMVWLPLATVIASLTGCGMRLVRWVAFTISDLPFAAVYVQSEYILFWIVLLYLLIGAYLLMKQKRPLVLCCCAVFGLLIAMLASWIEPMKDECRVTVLDVGQGQCVLLQAEGVNLLVDCGGDDPDQAADRAAALLLSQGISRLDGIILTHYDSDHAAGVPLLMQRLKTQVLLLPECRDPDGIRHQLLSSDTTAVAVRQVLELTFGTARVTLIPSQKGETDNESGLCVLFQTENCDILITGDRSEAGELELIRSIHLPQLELLIVGHHGSKYSTSRELLLKTRPQTAIISVGEDNRYGHPAPEVLQRLEQFDCIVYRTDKDGTVIFRR